MTPKEKAQELVELFIGLASDEETTEDGLMYSEAMRIFNAKQCALIAVEEIIKSLDDVLYPNPFNQYWAKVEQEIQNFKVKK